MHCSACMREARMLVRPLHVYHKTTHSHHHYRRHANLFKEGWAKTVASGCAQLWVADMTYLPTKEKAACLMVTDACSRKIVGWHVMECLLQRPADLPLARTMVCESVRLYNEHRPHGSVLLTIGGGASTKKPLHLHATACRVWCPGEDSNLHGVTR